jgi:hypothetical protein
MAFEVISQRAGYNAIYYRNWALRARATCRPCGGAAVDPLRWLADQTALSEPGVRFEAHC